MVIIHSPLLPIQHPALVNTTLRITLAIVYWWVVACRCSESPLHRLLIRKNRTPPFEKGGCDRLRISKSYKGDSPSPDEIYNRNEMTTKTTEAVLVSSMD
jgi:hypothetical protein